MQNIEVVITAREKDLGDLVVRRILPYQHCMIGPFIFFDHMGPTTLPTGKGVDVRPHPHIHLATVTYLFEGKIRHRDSLGSDQLIEPGAINWMVAGRGIVHSERTPGELRESGSCLNGIQCWLALPDEYENIQPTFTHYPQDVLPQLQLNNVEIQILLGSALGHQSPVQVYSDLFYLFASFPKGSRLSFSPEQREAAVYVVSGNVLINSTKVNHCEMAVGTPGQNLEIEALEDAKLMLLGGKRIGQRYIYWNFVSSSKDKILEAMSDWERGPGDMHSRFPKIPGDDQEFIPLPEEKNIDFNPKGTIM